jgi:hypothetical protein
MDALTLATRHGQKDVASFYCQLLEPVSAWRALLAAGGDSSDQAEAARRTVALILAMPEAQLG